ncbi:unnamed protein product, partial [marine sediment metagenome]
MSYPPQGAVTRPISPPLELTELVAAVCSEAEAAGLITAHQGAPSAHHAKYTDAEAQTTVKANVEVGDLKTPTKDLNMNDNTLTNIKKAVAAGQPLTYEQMKALVDYTWTGAAGEDSCLALTQDADYVYAGLYLTPAKVIKITKATMATSATWTGAAGENICRALTQDADYVYAGFNIFPAKVIK